MHFPNQVELEQSGATLTIYPEAAETDAKISARAELVRSLIDEDKIITVSSGSSTGIAPQARAALIEAYAKRLNGGATGGKMNTPSPVGDGENRETRSLAAQHLFPQVNGKAGIELSMDNVVVADSSSMNVLTKVLEEMAGTSPALETGAANGNGEKAKPKRILLVEEGHYSKVASHVRNAGMILACVSTGQDGKTDPLAWREAIEACGDQLGGVMITQPGNPHPVKYTRDEAMAITQVFNETGVKVIIDSAYDRIHNDYNHFATMPGMWSHTFVIGGVWGYRTEGDFKIGAGASGDAEWFRKVERRLRISIPAGTAEKFKIIVENTPESFFRENVERMVARQLDAKARVRAINERLKGAFPHLGIDEALRIVGDVDEGPFMVLHPSPLLLRLAGIGLPTDPEDERLEVEGGWPIADLLALESFLETIPGFHMGMRRPYLRLNVENEEKANAAFERLEPALADILGRTLTYEMVLERFSLPPVSDRQLEAAQRFSELLDEDGPAAGLSARERVAVLLTGKPPLGWSASQEP